MNFRVRNSPRVRPLAWGTPPLPAVAVDSRTPLVTIDYTVPSPDGPIGLSPMPRFVTTKGGGYFFLPGRRLIDYLVEKV